LENTLNQLLDVIENDLEAVVHDLPAQLLAPIFDQLATRLSADYLAGDTSPAALNRYMLAQDIDCLRHMVMATLPSIHFDRELILEPARELLAGLGPGGLTEQGVAWCQALKDLGPLLQTLFSAQFSLSTSGSASGSGGGGLVATPGSPQPLNLDVSTAGSDNNSHASANNTTPSHYLWYASWLLGKELYQQGDKIFEDELKLLFRGGGLFRASLEGGGDYLTVRETFAEHDITLSNTLSVVTEQDKPLWVMHDQGNEKTYTIVEEVGEYELYIYEGRVYLESDWSEINPLAGYTFKRVTPEACDLWAWILNFSGEYVEMILHTASIESEDFVSNLLNLLIHGTYGSLKVVGPRGFGWLDQDRPLRNPWLNWVLPIGVTTLASLEGIYTKDDAPHAMIYWLTLLGADLSEKFLYDHWAYMGRDAVLSIITLLNYNGDKAVPSEPDDTRPLNRKHIDGIVNLYVEAGVWIVAAAYSKSDFGFPNDDNLDKLGTLFGHWFGFGALAAVVSTIVGTPVAWALGWVIDWPAYGWMNLKAYTFTLAKYMFYQYFTHDGKTNDGKFDGSGDSYPGYPSDPENSPYLLPYERGTTYACAQGNLGIWSHTPHSYESQIYAFDFAMDKGDVILACRAGVVDDFEDGETDHSSGPWNYIRIRHDTIHDHDRDQSNANVITYATYGHGTFQSVREIWAEKLGRDVSTITRADIVNKTVQQGEPIMKAGDTGRSAYNHLHMHVKPQAGGSQGDYTIPFVFADVDEDDGRPRSLNAYESDNERK
jgi:hypothetical protein